jgi:hypothetical protein
MTPRIQSVRFIGAAHAARGKDWALIGQDGGQSIDLGDRTLFVFADTLLTLVPDELQGARPATFNSRTAYFVGNCAALSREPTLDGAMRNLEYYRDERGFPREILEPGAMERMAGHRLWPQHGIAVDGRVILFYLGILQFDSKSTWGFRPTGSGLALFDPARGTAERVMNGDEWKLWPIDDDLRIGTQVLRVGDTVYIFGSVRSHAIIARVDAAAITNPASYQYFTASDSWSGDVRDAHPLAACAPEFSVSFNEYLGAYLMVYADGAARELLLRAAPHPWGPYGEPLSAGKLPHREQAEVVALAFEHPQFARDGGKTVVISYCQPYFTQNSLVALTFA